MGRVGKQSAIYAIGVMVGKAASFLMLPVYTRYLTPTDYGTLQLIDLTIEVVSIVAGSRLGSGIFHFYHLAVDDEGRTDVLTSALVVLAGAFAAGGVVAFLAAPWLAQLLFHSTAQAALFRVAAASLALQGFVLVPMAYLQVIERPQTLIAFNLVRLVIQVVVNVVLLVGLHLGALGMLLGTLAANVVTGVGLTVMLVRQAGFRFTRPTAARIMRFGMPFIGTHMAKFVMTYGDRYVLQAAAGTAVVGVYSLAYQFGFLLAMLGDVPYRNAWEPIRFEVAKRADRDQVFARAFIHLNLLQVTQGVAISLFVPEFLRVMATPSFYQAANWVPFILAAYLGQSWSLFLNTGLFIKERTGLITWATWLGAFAAVAAYGALIPPLGGLGAALAALFSFTVLVWATHRYSQREWRIAYRWRPVIWMLLVATSVCSAGFLLVPPLPLVAALAVKAMLLMLYAGAMWMSGVLTAGERNVLRSFVRNPRAGFAAIRGRRE